jgi:hypothetical protein
MDNLEKIAFPAMAVAAVATIWVLLRSQAAQAAAAGANPAQTPAQPVPALGGGGGIGALAQFTQAPIIPYTYLAPTRLSPPYSDPLGPASTLLYPGNLSLAGVIGVGSRQQSGAAPTNGCCCGGGAGAESPAQAPASIPASAQNPSVGCNFTGSYWTDPATGCQLPIGDWCNQPVPAVIC